MTSSHIRSVFDSVDTLDAKGFANFFAPTGRITFGNNPAFEGRDAVETGTADFLDTIDGIKHVVVNEWEVGDSAVVELEVTYTRKDQQVVTIPVVSIWSLDSEGLIDDYRVFFDVAPVFA